MAKTVPELDAHLVRYGANESSARIYIDVEEVALWLSLVRDWCPPGDKQIVALIRDTIYRAIAEGNRVGFDYG